MWSAFMNGSGMHGGGGAGGGYVPSQGWEFVPCSGMDRADRGRGKSRSPARRISSPPTVFSHIYDSQFGASRDGGDAGAQLEILRGPMWPGLEPLQQQQQTQQQQTQQQQTQHTRLKKKFEDLKKRHVQDKEEWMREKESLLREVADIQGGENRRILLELKSVLEDVQVEVKREEEKRSELQLQYTRDRCAWELEKAELKCRIAQLEARECAGFIGGGGGVQSAALAAAAALRGETSALRHEREEEQRRRLLADTHATAMDLRCRLELSERGWRREKAELLERFDEERREWESQLKDMQRKIETLYCDVRTKREVKGGGRPDDGGGDGVHGLGVHGLAEFSSRGARRRDSAAGDGVEAFEPDASFGGTPEKNVSNGHEDKVCVRPEEKPLWAEPSDRKRNTTALNAALKEIARVSEELCSYQDEIRKKSADKRNRSESLSPSEGSEPTSGRDETRLQVDEEEEAPCDLGQIYDDLRALERETWIASSAESSTWRADGGGPSGSWIADFTETEDAKPSAAGSLLWEIDAADGPPVPPRSSSWTLSSPTLLPDTELYIPESPVMTARSCHSPCALLDKKCSSSPSVVRKFEAMLQENEGKVLVDGVVASRLAAPASADGVSKGCCHARWSCDASKFTNKLSTYGTVQKSFSEVNIVTAAKGSDYCPRNPELQIPQMLSELPLDLLLSSLEAPPDLQSSRRNITLEQKTAEFNRTLFQAEMGRGVEQRTADAGSQPVFSPTGAPDGMVPPGEATVRPLCANVTSPLSISNPTIPMPEVQSRGTRCGEQGIPSDLSSEPPQTTTTTTTSRSLARRCEVKPRGQTASGPPSGKAQPRAAAEALCSEPVSPGQSADGSGFFENEKPQSARVGVSAQQQSAENQHRQRTPPPRLASVLPSSQPDPSSRPGPRAMSEHPWKALTLAAYPRPEGSRSNYGAVERILRNYESAARAQQNRSRPDGTDCSPGAGVGPPAEDNVPEPPDAPDMDPLASPPALRHATHTQLSGAVTELHLTVEVTSASSSSSSSSSSAQKNFSRPARPARRRLPSRWAGRSPASSSVSSSSPSATPSFALHKHSSSFSYSHAFHMETVII